MRGDDSMHETGRAQRHARDSALTIGSVWLFDWWHQLFLFEGASAKPAVLRSDRKLAASLPHLQVCSSPYKCGISLTSLSFSINPILFPSLCFLFQQSHPLEQSYWPYRSYSIAVEPFSLYTQSYWNLCVFVNAVFSLWVRHFHKTSGVSFCTTHTLSFLSLFLVKIIWRLQVNKT